MIRLPKGRDGIVGIAGFSLLGLVVVFMALGVLLLLMGCGEKVAEKVAEKAVEKAAEDGGGDVDVDIGSDGDSGSISIKDGDSEIEMGGATDAPEGFPEELVHPEGKIMMSQKRTVDGSVEMFVQSSVNSEPTEVNEYYESAVDDLGFTVEEGCMMNELPGRGGVVIQGEDEISSIGMCLGAVAAGRRAMTASSGPGMSLYSENIGLAIMGEMPLVIVNVQRQGPATGSATKGADGDVQFMRWGTSGGFPMIVLSPENVRDCYLLTFRAFRWAERFRCPVIVASQKEVGLTREVFDLEEARQNRGPEVVRRKAPADGAYLPHDFVHHADVGPLSPMGGSVPPP